MPSAKCLQKRPSPQLACLIFSRSSTTRGRRGSVEAVNRPAGAGRCVRDAMETIEELPQGRARLGRYQPTRSPTDRGSIGSGRPQTERQPPYLPVDKVLHALCSLENLRFFTGATHPGPHRAVQHVVYPQSAICTLPRRWAGCAGIMVPWHHGGAAGALPASRLISVVAIASSPG